MISIYGVNGLMKRFDFHKLINSWKSVIISINGINGLIIAC